MTLSFLRSLFMPKMLFLPEALASARPDQPNRNRLLRRLLKEHGFKNVHLMPFHGWIFAKIQVGGSHASIETRDNEIYILGLWTDPASRGKGNGERLLRTILHVADIAGVDVRLDAGPYGTDCWTLERLVAWYERFGFVVNGTQNGEQPMIRKSQNVGQKIA